MLVACPSNAAVDVLLELVHKQGVKVVRLGDPNRTAAHLRHLTTDGQIAKTETIEYLEEKLQNLRLYHGKKLGSSIGKTYGLLEKEKAKAAKKIIGEAEVVMATCTVVGSDSILEQIDQNKVNLKCVDNPELFGGALNSDNLKSNPLYNSLIACFRELLDWLL